MGSMFFGQYLPSRGAIDRETLMDAIDAVCDCINIIGDHASTQIEASGFRFPPEPQFSTEGDEPAGGSKSSIRASVMAGDISLEVRVFV